MNQFDKNITSPTVRLASEDDAQAWSDYVDNSAFRTYGHRWHWREIISESFGAEPYYFLAEQGGRIVGVLPSFFMSSTLFGRFLISLPWLDYGGPLADSSAIAGALVDRASAVAKEKRCRFLEMRAVQQPLEGLVEKTDKYAFHLSLGDGEEATWMSFDAKARNQVRKAEKSGLTTEIGGPELINEFYRIFSYNMRDLGTPVWPKSLFVEISRRLDRDCEFALVRLDREPIAGAMIIHYQDFSAVPSASAYRKYLKLCPNNLMYWDIIKHCAKRGSRTFDFGRSTFDAGTYHFKKQWVKNPEPQRWQYSLLSIDALPELNPNNPRFKAAISIWRKLPLSLANLLGPRIVTKLP